jgi:hypothetical protein
MTNFFDQFDPQEEPTGNFFDQFDASSVQQPALPEPGTYTENEMVEDDRMFNIINNYMLDRYGLQSVEGLSREKIVDDFLDNRRGVSAGNTVRGLSEMDYLNDIKDNKDKTANAAAAAALFENMAGLYSKETTLGEKVRGTGDYVRTALLDPINLAGGLVGKFIGGGAVRVGTQSAKKVALREMAKKQAAGATPKVVAETGKKVFIKAVDEAGKITTNQVKNYSAQLIGSKGLKRLAQKGALAEIAAVTSIETAVSVGMEYLYQDGLVELGVRDDYDKFAMGIAALGATAIGAVQAGKVVLRGSSDVAAPSVTVKEPDAKGMLVDIAKSIEEYTNALVPKTGSWKNKVKGGVELKDLDTDFFVDLLLGHVDDEGNVVLKGMAQIAQERGLRFTRRGDGDLYSNWMADMIKQSDPAEIKQFIKAFEKSTGNKLKQAKTLTVEEFADTFAAKMNGAARVLNAASQGAKLNGLSAKDLEIAEMIDTALDLGFLKKPDDPYATRLSEQLPEFIRNNQNRLIRLLVSNPSTSALNMIGWGANAGLNTVSDMALMTLHAGRGTLAKAIGMEKAGEKSYKIARSLFESNAFRMRLLLDPDMTHAAFESALTRNTEALQTLASTLPGGIDNVTRLVTDGKFTPNQKLLGQYTDDAVDLIQTLSFVKAQDSFTKSQEFIFQMDKELRLVTGKGWSEFYNWEDAAKFMATKEYAEIEAKAVDKTLESIFSKSYKGPGLVGEVAAVIEDARNIPGVGLLIPFGRFFNNTVDFGIQATGLSIAGKAVGKYSDKNYSELFTKAAVSWGMASAMVQNERENRKAGLGLYQESIGGEVVTRQYDYPVSFFKAWARIGSYYMDGEEPPAEVLQQIARDFTLEGVLRNLDQTQQDVTSIFFYMFQGDMKEMWRAFGKSAGGLVSQQASAITRFVEPVNTLAGIARGEQARPIDRYQGSKWYNDSVRYIDNIIPLFTGEPVGETLKQAATGEADITSTKSLGVRSIRLTDTQRVMNMLGYEQFDINAARQVRTKAPEAANEYNGILFDVIEAKASALMDSKAFRNMPLDRQRLYWKKEILPEAQELAKNFLYLQYSGPLDTIDLQYELAGKYTNKKLDEAIEELNFDGEIGDMTRGELYVLKEYLSTVEQIELLKVPAEVGAGQYGR